MRLPSVSSRPAAGARLVALLCAAALALPASNALALPAPAAQPLSGGEEEVADALAVNRASRDEGGLASWPEDAAPGSVLVTTTDASALSRALGQLERADGAGVGEPVDGRVLAQRVGQVSVAEGHEREVADRLAALPGVVAVEPDRLRAVAATPDDPEYPRQWAHARTGAAAAWDVTTGSPDVRVAVIDSGIDAGAADLQGNVIEQVDASSGVVRRWQGLGDRDACGHGTAVAGVLGASGNNGRDVAGVAWEVGLIDIAVMAGVGGECGGIPDSAIIAGLQYAANHPAGAVDVATMSLGGEADSCPQALQTAVDSARSRGVVVVAAAGNHQLDAPGATAVPASCNGVVAVGATRQDDRRASYSAANHSVDLVAPGGDHADGTAGLIVTTRRGGGTTAVAGTSFAAPYVAGVAALLRAIAPGLSPDGVEATLEQTARDLGAVGRDDATGWGLVQATAAVTTAAGRAATGAPTPVPAPDPSFPVAAASVYRVSAGAPTDPVAQAVATSQVTFADGGAQHALLARSGGFAGALAGSALAYGVGPILFTAARGPLNATSASELRRVLPRGRRVYLLGDAKALPAALDGQLRDLGYVPVRFAGSVREETAVRVAEEVRRLLPRLGHVNPRAVVLANSRKWPGAVTAGQLSAMTGIPALLTPPSRLPRGTASAITSFAPDVVYVIGDEHAVARHVATAAQAAARSRRPGATIVRLAGGNRVSTALAVAARTSRLLRWRDGQPGYAVAVNLRTRDGYAHALSAAVFVGARSGVFVPVDGARGTTLARATCDAFRGWRIDGVLAGGRDVLSDGLGSTLRSVLRGNAAAC